MRGFLFLLYEERMVQKALWYLNRVAAGLVLAATSGAILAVGDMAYIEITTRQMWPRDQVEFVIAYGLVAGALLGTLPGTLIMCFSRAKYAPWHSVPLLLVGTELALAAVYVSTTKLVVAGGIISPFGLLIAGATAGGILASLFLPAPVLRGDCFASAPQDDKA